MTTLRDIMKYLQEIAPREMTIAGLDCRVEIGPQTESEQAKTTVSRVLVATYASARIVAKASQDKANLVVTGLPLFPYALDRLAGLDLVRTRLLSKNYISSYYVGSGYIGARDGITDAFVEALGLSPLRNFDTSGDYSDTVPVGRVCTLDGERNHSGFVNLLATKLGLEHVMFSGDLDSQVGEVLVIPGTHIDMPELVNATRRDVMTVVTGELAPEVRLFASEEGMNTLELGPFATAEPGMRRLRHRMELEFADLKMDFAESTPYYKALKPYQATKRSQSD